MQKRTIITVSIIAGVVLLGGTAAVAGPIVYRDLIVGEADVGADRHGRAERDGRRRAPSTRRRSREPGP